MFWKRKESKLQLGEPQDKIWNHQIVKSSFVSARSQDIIAYAGWAYVLEEKQQGGVFSGRATCNTLQRALFDLDVAVSESASVTVSCNGERVWSDLVEVAADSSCPTLHHLSIDITQQKETKAVSDIDVEFVFANRLGTIWVLADEDTQWAPKIQQIASWPYATWSILFFAAAWGGLIGLLIVGISVSGTGIDPRLSTLIAVLGTLIGYLGLRDLAKIPLGEALRRLYAWTRSRRSPFAITGLVFLSIVSSLAAIVFLELSWRRYDYSDRINSYFDGGRRAKDLRDAFILEPWRREAQILFEQAAVRERTDREKFRAHVRIFTDNEMVRSAVRGAGPEAPFYLGGHRSAISDPVRWFASMLPEGDGEKEWGRTDLAIELLETLDTCEAKLDRLVLSIQRSQTKERVFKLFRELDASYRDPDCDTTDYSVQVALDMLGNISILMDFDKAVVYFNKLLQYRSKSKTEVRNYWRAPDKLVLFALFRSKFDDLLQEGADPKQTVAPPILEYKINGVPFRRVFETAIYDANANKKFQDLAGWNEGTIVSLKREWISATLKIGWKF